MTERKDSIGRTITKKTIYPLEFKLRVLKATEVKPLQQVLQEFGMPHKQTVQYWRKNRERLLEQAALKQSSKRFYRSQLTLLKRALKRAARERDILKKAISYFAKQQRRSASTSLNTKAARR